MLPPEYAVRIYCDAKKHKFKRFLETTKIPAHSRVQCGGKILRLLEDAGPETAALTRFKFAEPGVFAPTQFTSVYVIYRKGDKRLWGIGEKNGLAQPHDIAKLGFTDDEIADLPTIATPLELPTVKFGKATTPKGPKTPKTSAKANGAQQLEFNGTAGASDGSRVAVAARAVASEKVTARGPKAREQRSSLEHSEPTAPRKTRAPVASARHGASPCEKMLAMSGPDKIRAFDHMARLFDRYSCSLSDAMLDGKADGLTNIEVVVANNLSEIQAPRRIDGQIAVPDFRYWVVGLGFKINGKDEMLDFTSLIPAAK